MIWDLPAIFKILFPINLPGRKKVAVKGKSLNIERLATLAYITAFSDRNDNQNLENSQKSTLRIDLRWMCSLKDASQGNRAKVERQQQNLQITVHKKLKKN